MKIIYYNNFLSFDIKPPYSCTFKLSLFDYAKFNKKERLSKDMK